MPRKQLVVNQGDKYGRLTIIKEVEKHTSIVGKTTRKFLCSCQCGNTKEVDLQSLRDGATQSCGCLKKQNQNKLYIKMTTR
jgi:hypothetical protein